MVNIGGLLGPFAGSLARRYLGGRQDFSNRGGGGFRDVLLCPWFFREPKRIDDRTGAYGLAKRFGTSPRC